jgi:hypothetical protein
MRSSTSFSELFLLALLAWLLCLVPAGTAHAALGNTVSTTRDLKIAVLPVINLSGGAAPLKDIRNQLLDAAEKQGMKIMAEKDLEQFMARHRIRYTGGLDEATAQAFHDEAGVDMVLVTSLQQYSAPYPPKISLDARLLATGALPRIVWADAVSISGDDAPGLFGTGLIDNPAQLTVTAVRRLAASMAKGAANGEMESAQPRVGAKFGPRRWFRAPGLASGEKSRVAVVPFFNQSQRTNAGELLALQFVRELARQGVVKVIEPGVVRQKFLAFRIIMDEGLSIANAEILFEVLDADLIVSGNVVEYDDYEGSLGSPKAAFSVWVMDRATKRVVWASESHNSGDEGVYFFDIGKQRTAQLLGRNMVMGVVEKMLPPITTVATANFRKSGENISSRTTKEGEK